MKKVSLRRFTANTRTWDSREFQFTISWWNFKSIYAWIASVEKKKNNSWISNGLGEQTAQSFVYIESRKLIQIRLRVYSIVVFVQETAFLVEPQSPSNDDDAFDHNWMGWDAVDNRVGHQFDQHRHYRFMVNGIQWIQWYKWHGRHHTNQHGGSIVQRLRLSTRNIHRTHNIWNYFFGRFNGKRNAHRCFH